MKQNKNSVIVRIILWTLTALILLGVLLWGLELLPGLSIRGLSFGGWDFHYKDSAQYQVGSGSVSAAGLRSLEVNWVDGSVHLEVTDGDSVVFREPDGLDEEDQLRFQVVGDRLIIQYSKPRWGFWLSCFPTGQAPERGDPPHPGRAACGAAGGYGERTGNRHRPHRPGLRGGQCFRKCDLHRLLLWRAGNGHRLRRPPAVWAGKQRGIRRRIRRHGPGAASGPRKVSTDTISGSIHLTLPQDAAFSVELDSASGKLDNEFSSTKTGDIYYCGQGGGTFSLTPSLATW